MIKAHIITKDGTKITIEGSTQEVAALVSQLKIGIQTAKATTGRAEKYKSKPVASPSSCPRKV